MKARIRTDERSLFPSPSEIHLISEILREVGGSVTNYQRFSPASVAWSLVVESVPDCVDGSESDIQEGEGMRVSHGT
jgi:hypothetical protein